MEHERIADPHSRAPLPSQCGHCFRMEGLLLFVPIVDVAAPANCLGIELDVAPPQISNRFPPTSVYHASIANNKTCGDDTVRRDDASNCSLVATGGFRRSS
jgi:hypothetical protein